MDINRHQVNQAHLHGVFHFEENKCLSKIL